jgi:iron(III) transport system permease protein
VQAIARKIFAGRRLASHGWNFRGWHLPVFGFAFLVAAPLAFLFFSISGPSGEIMEHLRSTLLGELLRNTFYLVSGVSAGTLVFGVGLAWLNSVYEYPGKRFFVWALMLPLAIPAYVMAFVFLGLFDFMGPVQGLLRRVFGPQAALPEIRSHGGVILVMTLVLYPYVYLLARNAFVTQGSRLLEVSRTLGYGPVKSFFKVMLPVARPWIASGLLLVIMETLADFGTVAIFNYDTFTTAIYKVWFGLFSVEAAAQLSSILVVLALVVLVVEQKSRGSMSYSRSEREGTSPITIKLSGIWKWGAFTVSSTVFIIAFILPVGQLLVWCFEVFGEEFGERYLSYLYHTLLLGLISAIVVCAAALLIAYAKRILRDGVTDFLCRVSTLGYALPGTILAVGIFIPVAKFDNLIIEALALETSSILKGTVVVLVVAYCVRFMAAGFGAIDSALNRIGRSLDDASQTLGSSGLHLLLRVHAPLLKGGIATGAILVLVDVMKEMPITLMMRPFGWDTLAVKIFELTSEGEWERASIAAVSLVLAGLVPVRLLSREGDKG